MLIIQALDIVLAKKFTCVKWKLYKRSGTANVVLTFFLWKDTTVVEAPKEKIEEQGVFADQLQTLLEYLGFTEVKCIKRHSIVDNDRLVQVPVTDIKPQPTVDGSIETETFHIHNVFAEMTLTPNEFNAYLASLN